MDESSFADLDRNTRLVYTPFEAKGLLVVVELTEKPEVADASSKAVAAARFARGVRTEKAKGKDPEEAWQETDLWLEGSSELEGLPPPKVGAADVRRMEPSEYWIGYEPKTVDDKAAIALPDAFVATQCEFSWDRIQDMYKKERLTHPHAGMQAILDYRWWITEKLLNSVKPMTSLRVRRLRTALLPTLKRELGTDWLEKTWESEWIRTANDMSWGMPGSVEPTSDIDLNSWNDGTEWAVRSFNSAFQSLHDGKESGTVFDVNLYAQDFKPDVEPVKEKAPESAEEPLPDGAARPLAKRPYQRPDRGYAFATEDRRAEDVREQETVSLLHLRRHAPEPLWDYYKNLSPPGAASIAAAEERYSKNQEELENARGLMKKVFESREQAVDDDARLMAAENRLYEVRLGRVEKAKQKFDFAAFAFRKARVFRRAVSTEKRRQLEKSADEAFFHLKTLRSRAVYFANESYATAGSLVQVVAGKQELSRGVARRKKKPSPYNNIAYTADELLHSLHEQVGFIFHAAVKIAKKEGGGDLASRDLYDRHAGKFLIKASKYFHRLFNALKHLYFIYYHVAERAGRANADWESGEWAQGWPKFLHENPVEYEKIRRACGYGIEELKKFDPAPPATDPYILDVTTTPNDVEYLVKISERLCLDEVTGNAAMADITSDPTSRKAVAEATLAYLGETKPEGVAKLTYEFHFKKLELKIEKLDLEHVLKHLLQIAVRAAADYRKFSKIPVSTGTHRFPYWLENRRTKLAYPYPVPRNGGEGGAAP